MPERPRAPRGHTGERAAFAESAPPGARVHDHAPMVQTPDLRERVPRDNASGPFSLFPDRIIASVSKAAQPPLPIAARDETVDAPRYGDVLRALLRRDLGFHGADNGGASHLWHPFPAKFPPQLPHTCIEHLTVPGETVLDPMMGSGTTLVEALLLGRKAVGCDIDPMALLIARVKSNPLDRRQVLEVSAGITAAAIGKVANQPDALSADLDGYFDDAKTRHFIDYWFLKETQLELMALLREIEGVASPALRDFFKMVFSSTIIAKSGGVSLARDLAHTRPHRDVHKKPKSAIHEFDRLLRRNIKHGAGASGDMRIHHANATTLPLQDDSVDLVVTSPPYANNAIDYMRAHKFSLVWFGHRTDDLSRLRGTYIGHDAVGGFAGAPLPEKCENTIAGLNAVNEKKARALRRYCCEMRGAIGEMFRVLGQGRAAVIVVGSSVLSGVDVETHTCLAALGEQCGFRLIGIGARQLDRNRRMMPARWDKGRHTKIEERMHEEVDLDIPTDFMSYKDRRAHARGAYHRVAEAVQ